MGIRWLHFVVAALLCAAMPARAETQFALVCVGTDTDDTVAYEFRWKDATDWESDNVEPGEWTVYSWPYDYPGEDQSPTPQVRYDDDMGPGVNYVVTDLEAYAAEYKDCEEEAKTYNFYERDDELFIGSSD